jgi:hypothetical protein
LLEVKSDGTTLDHGYGRPTVQPHVIGNARSYWVLSGTQVYCSMSSSNPPVGYQVWGWELNEFTALTVPSVELVKPYHYELR